MSHLDTDVFLNADVFLSVVAGALMGLLIRSIRYLNRPVALRSPKTAWLLGGVGGGLVFILLAKHFGWTFPAWDWILVSIIGGAVGVGELASRYRDEPIKAILSVPATIYVLLNALAAVIALVLGRHFGLWATPKEPVDWAQVLAAGFGSMVILRSAVFHVRVGDKDVGVGPSSFLQSVIDAADRAVDRLRAQERAWAVANVMVGISSERAMKVLPLYISALLQNLRPEEQSKFDERVTKIRGGSESNQVKAFVLGLVAMNYAGERVLSAAIGSLQSELRDSAADTAGAAAGAVQAARNTTGATARVVATLKDVVGTFRAGATLPEVAQAAAKAEHAAQSAKETAEATLNQTMQTERVAQNTASLAAAQGEPEMSKSDQPPHSSALSSEVEKQKAASGTDRSQPDSAN